MKERKLFTVEYEDGEMVDATGDGGFTVFLSAAEVQDCLDTTQSSIDDPTISLRIVCWREITQ